MDNPSQPATTLPSSPTCKAVDMEAAIERLEFDTMNPDNIQEENHYATPAKQLHEAMRSINDSAANRARAAHETDSFHQRNEWEMCWDFWLWDKFYFIFLF